jgi:hypothetical protein
VLEPDVAHVLLVTDQRALLGVQKAQRFIAQKHTDAPEGAEHDAARERLLDLVEKPAYDTEPRQILRSPVVRFGIVEWVGEPRVDVVCPMSVVVALVRQPQ